MLAIARKPCDVISKPRLRSATRTGDFADELEEIEMLISSNKQREKSPSQIAREGSELQRIESVRSERRRLSTLKQNADTDVQNLGQRGRTDKHVADSLGISQEQWRKIRTIFERAKSGDAEAVELMKALDAGSISVYAAYQEVRKQLDGERGTKTLCPLSTGRWLCSRHARSIGYAYR